MNLLIFSDLHLNQIKMPEENPDVVVLLGDIYWKTVEKIDLKYHCPKIGVLGNHDPFDLYQNTNFELIHGVKKEIKGVHFAGFSGSPTYSHKEIPQYSEWEVEKFTEDLKGVDIFIAHSNPQVYFYPIEDRSHRGFRTFTDYIHQKKPKYFLHGHLHISKETNYKQTSIIGVYGYKTLTI